MLCEKCEKLGFCKCHCRPARLVSQATRLLYLLQVKRDYNFNWRNGSDLERIDRVTASAARRKDRRVNKYYGRL